ncbi:MAG: tyrosine-type recombinase/integrase [Verrucomicrobiia bacterium]|jgi:integrase/recombinase XerD
MATLNPIPPQPSTAPEPGAGGATLDTLSARYLQHLESLNYSPPTLTTKQVYFNRFGEFLAEARITGLQTVTATTLADFQRWIFYQPTVRGMARGVSSQNRVLSAIRNFFKFLHHEGYLAHNPAQDLRLSKEPDALPKNVLTPEEARKILEAPDTHTRVGYRDRTLLEVLYASGIRKAELRNLTVDAVNLEEELLRVNRGKGRKDRVVPLSAIACRYLENYIKVIRPEMLHGKQTDTLFVSVRHGLPIGVNGLGPIIDKYVRRAGVKKRVTCHLWRHSCATHLLKNDANLRHVQEMLGHKSLATTERYLRLTITDLKEAHRKFHPREQQERRKAARE